MVIRKGEHQDIIKRIEIVISCKVEYDLMALNEGAYNVLESCKHIPLTLKGILLEVSLISHKYYGKYI